LEQHVHSFSTIQNKKVRLSRMSLILGIVVMLIALRNHQHTLDQIERGELKLPARWSLSVILCLILCGLGMGMAIYLSVVKL
jgi:hypothetical protein